MSFLLILLVVAVAWAVYTFNRLVKQENILREGWSGIDVQLKRRHDLIPNLVEAVKAYASHEKTLFEKIAAERNINLATASPQEIERAENSLTSSIKACFALAEAYPDLKASSTFLDLHTNLVKVENDLQYARRYYNGTVRDWNNLCESFPQMLVASAMNKAPKAFFEIETATEREAPKVDLGGAQ